MRANLRFVRFSAAVSSPRGGFFFRLASSLHRWFVPLESGILVQYRPRWIGDAFLVGANPNAARLNGINVNRVKFMSYVISGVLCAFAGMLGAAQQQTAKCQIFDKYAFNSLIAVIVGGTAFTGGIGTYAGSIAGSLLMVVLDNALTLMNMSQDTQNVTRGVVMILLLIIYNRQKSVRQ
jgi:ribose/xylose/arabinose/galactoside ABC-type transport system permease subunit